MTTFNSVMTAILVNTTAKIATAFGVGFVSYTGIDYMGQRFVGFIKGQLSQFPADALALFTLSGAPDALNWIFSAFAFSATIKSTSKLTAQFRK